MHTYAIRSAVLSTVGLALALVLGSALAATYRLTDLGTLGGAYSQGTSLNASGQATGSSGTAGGDNHAFLWDGTGMQDLGTLGRGGYGEAINDSGQVTGTSDASSGFHAFLWDGTRIRDLGTLGGTYSRGVAINASGQVTGDAQRALGNFRAFLWSGTTMQNLGTLGGLTSKGVAINDAGQVTGYSTTTTAGNGPGHAFLWDGTKMRDLGTLGGRSSGGTAINASGQVAGSSTTAAGPSHAFLWDGTGMQDLGTLGTPYHLGSSGVAVNASGKVMGYSYASGGGFHTFFWDGTRMQDLGTLGGTTSRGFAINAAGQVTGWSHTVGIGPEHAFLWDGTTLHDLHDLIDPADPLQPFVTLVVGVDINDRGQILANGYDSRTDGTPTHAYLLSPVESPPGVSFSLRPRSLAFGEQPIGSRTTMNLWLLNKGTAPLTIQQLSLRGTDRSQFGLHNQCAAALAPGTGCRIGVTFHPTSAGLKTARVRLTAGDVTRIRELSGTGR